MFGNQQQLIRQEKVQMPRLVVAGEHLETEIRWSVTSP
jgi:hypothetical protein